MVNILPFQLQDGQKAYASKLMANFNYLLDYVNRIEVPGMPPGDLESILLELKNRINKNIKSYETGNAKKVLFGDGASLQSKLDNGDLKGADGVVSTSDGFYYFYVGDDSHLYLVTRSETEGNAFAINEAGHLVYTVDNPPPEVGEPKKYDLGSVRFNGVTNEEFQNNNTALRTEFREMINNKVVTRVESGILFKDNWYKATSDNLYTIGVSAHLGAGNVPFFIACGDDATIEQRKEFNKHMMWTDGQSSIGFYIKTDSEESPAMDIPITIIILPEPYQY